MLDMSNEDFESAFGLGIVQEITKMKYRSKEIKLVIQNDPIDRLRVKTILFDLSGIAFTIHSLLKSISKDLKEKNEIGSSREDVLKVYEKLGHSLADYAKMIDDRLTELDSDIRNKVFQLITGLTVEINYFEIYMIALNQAISPFAKILEFIAEKPLGLDEKWVAAVCYLSAFDILVNRKRKELGIAKKPEDEKKLDFYTRFDALVKELESRSGELSKIVKQMPKLFWPIRVDVIHYGYVPSQEELDLILNWSQNIMKVITEEPK